MKLGTIYSLTLIFPFLVSAAPVRQGGDYEMLSESTASFGVSRQFCSGVHAHGVMGCAYGKLSSNPPDYSLSATPAAHRVLLLQNDLPINPDALPEGSNAVVRIDYETSAGATGSISGEMVRVHCSSDHLSYEPADSKLVASKVGSNEVHQVTGLFGILQAVATVWIENTGNDDYGSYAGDGIGDQWQLDYYGENNPDAGPEERPDPDSSRDNFSSYAANLAPSDSQPAFWIEMDGGVARFFYRRLNGDVTPRPDYGISFYSNLTDRAATAVALSVDEVISLDDKTELVTLSAPINYPGRSLFGELNIKAQ